jgi:hypothetical protein
MDLQTVHHIDFPPRLRLVKNGEIEAARVDLNQAYAEHLQRAAVEADTRRDIRVKRWQRRVAWLCAVLFYALLGYFSFQIGRSF